MREILKITICMLCIIFVFTSCGPKQPPSVRKEVEKEYEEAEARAQEKGIGIWNTTK